MNRNLFIIAIVAISLALVAFIFYPTPSSVPSIDIEKKKNNEVVLKPKDVIIEEVHQSQKTSLIKKKDFSQKISKQEELLAPQESPYRFISEKEVKRIVEKEHLEPVIQTDSGVVVYAKPQNSDVQTQGGLVIPPMTPTILQIQAPNGAKIEAIIPSEKIAGNKKIIIDDQDQEVAVEVDLEKQRDQNILTPPAIGQNR